MKGTKGEEEFVLESEGRKRGNEESDYRPAERVKVEVEGEAADDETKEEERKVERLRGLLADDPKKLSNKDMEEVIKCLNVDEIIRLAPKPRQGKASDDDNDDDGGKLNHDPERRVKTLHTVRSMLCGIELVEVRDIRLAYEDWPPKAFGMVLLSAMDSYAVRRLSKPLQYTDHYDIIPALCVVFPFKLVAHILREKAIFRFGKERDEEETRQRQKEAAGRCGYCSGKAEHTGMYGEHCPLTETVPIGTKVPAGYWIKCRRCGEWAHSSSDLPFEGCIFCDHDVGRAVPIPPCYSENKDKFQI